MATRKPTLSRAPARPDLDDLIKKARDIPLNDEMLKEQRASFAYGNAPEGSSITKESAMRASQTFRLVSA